MKKLVSSALVMGLACSLLMGSPVSAAMIDASRPMPVIDNAQYMAYYSGEVDEDEALSIAIADAGYSRSEVYNDSVQIDGCGGDLCYDVVFCACGHSYVYMIDAMTGEILDVTAN